MDGTWHPPADAWATTQGRALRQRARLRRPRRRSATARSTTRSGSGTRSCDHLGIPFATPYDAGARRLATASRGRRWFTGGRTNLADACVDRWADGDARRRGRSCGRARTATPARGPTPSCGAEADGLAAAARAPRRRRGRRRRHLPADAPGDGRRGAGGGQARRRLPAVFSGYGAEAVRVRLEDAGAKALITADAFPRRGKPVPMLATALEAAGDTPTIVVVDRLGTDVAYDDRVAPVAAAGQRAVRHPGRRQRAHRCSSPTRRAPPAGPRASVHVHGGWTVKVAEEGAFQTDIGPGDRVFWLTDLGWIMGPWLLTAGLGNGATVLPLRRRARPPRPRSAVGVRRRATRVTALRRQPDARPRAHGPRRRRAGAPTTCRRCASSAPPASRGTRTRGAGTSSVVGGGRCPVINISGGTEVGACFLSPHPVQPISPMSLGGPSLGMAVDVFDDDGRPVRGAVGELVCTKPWPGMTRGPAQRPRALPRDLLVAVARRVGARRLGRSSDVDGRPSGSCTVAATTPSRSPASGSARPRSRRALVSHPAVVEAAAVGLPDELKGEQLWGYVVLAAGRRRRRRRCAPSSSTWWPTQLGKSFRPGRRPVRAQPAEDPQRQGRAPGRAGRRHRRRPRRPVVARGPGRPRRRAGGELT